MNVLFTLDSLNRGGAEVMLLDVCRNAKNAGIDATFVATGDGPLESDFRASGVNFIKIPRKLPVDPALIKKLRTLIKELRIDVVHAQQPVEALHLVLAATGLQVKAVMSAQGLVMDRKNRLTAKLVFPRLDRVFAVSQSMFDRYREAGFDVSNFTVVLNCVDPKRLEATGEARFRRELGLVDDQPLAAMIGNFYQHRAKDQLTVCRAAAEVVKTFPDFVIAFAGGVRPGGETYHNECREFVVSHGLSENVIFLGARSDVPDILSAIDLMIFSSIAEGMPIGLIEAMLAGVPIVASNIAPILETTGGTAELFAVGDDRALARLLVSLFADKAERTRLSAEAGARALQLYSVNAHLRALTAEYEVLLSQ